MTDKLSILKQIIDTQDEVLLKKIADLLQEESGVDINGIKAIPHQTIPKQLDIEQLKKEQSYDPNGLKNLMEQWDYSIWKDVNIEQAIKEIGK